MEQQVNLYQSLPKEPAFTITVKFMVQIVILFSLILLLVWLYGELGNLVLSIEQSHFASKQQDAIIELNNTSIRYPGAFKNTTLKDENEKLTQQIADKNKLLQTLAGSSSASQYTGFSKFLTDLSKSIVDGVWLTDIDIQQGGAQITLKGDTISTNVGMQFLQNLKQTPSFLNKKFKVLSLVKDPDKKGVLDFAISTINTDITPSATTPSPSN